jgi:hypothetical protein
MAQGFCIGETHSFGEKGTQQLSSTESGATWRHGMAEDFWFPWHKLLLSCSEMKSLISLTFITWAW